MAVEWIAGLLAYVRFRPQYRPNEVFPKELCLLGRDAVRLL
jgi:hypothetical protein